MADLDLQDELPYRDYNMNPSYYHVPDERPSILKRTSRLISAAVNNYVEVLKGLLDSSYWYNVTDRDGYNLLHISMWFDSKEVFNYLLSLPNFPIDPPSKLGESILDLAWEADLENFEDDPPNEYYMCKFVQKGIDLVTSSGTDILHLAAQFNHPQVLKLLIEQGKDINVPDSKGETALELALNSYEDWFENGFEIVSTLLEHGAEVTIDSFKKSVLNSDIPHEVQEFFYLCVKDLLSELEINLEVILQLAKNESPLFDELLKGPLKINTDLDGPQCFYLLGSMKPVYVRKIIEKFDFAIFEVFENLDKIYMYEIYDPFNVESLDVMLQSALHSEIIRILNTTKGTYLIPESYFNSIKNIKGAEKKARELCCLLLSYGVNINFEFFERVYSRFGYCELFKILLHMDITEIDLNQTLTWPLFIYEPKISFQTFLENLQYYELGIMPKLIHYFHHPKFVEVLVDKHYRLTHELAAHLDHNPMLLECYGTMNLALKNKNRLLMPCLIELARNKFREYFINEFDIKTSRQFLTMLNSLPINNVYKKIITYETNLY